MSKPGSLAAWAVAPALGLALIAAAAGVGAASGTLVGGIAVYPPEEVAAMCVREGATTYLEIPGARRYAIDLDRAGLYWPMPLTEVLEALAQIGYPLDGLKAQVVILPAPRQGLAESSTEGSVVFLSPGRIGYPTAHVHYTVAHEVGHLVHHALLPGRDDPGWRQYAALRDLDLGAARSAQDHASRLHEIFAEDFRSLFGGGLAQCGSGIENHDLAMPQTVAGLREFFLSLPDMWGAKVRFYVAPNPFRDLLAIKTFSLGQTGGALAGATIYNVEGRMVAALSPSGPQVSELVWDGRDADGRRAPPGVYFAALRGGSKPTVLTVIKMP
ncbi:MAG: hypothetical protein WAW06_10730 [bacterium]